MTVVDAPRFLDEWDAKRAGMAQPATLPAVPNRGPRPHYTQAAIDGETAAVRAAPEGERNGQLNTSALKLGRLVASGLLDEDTARAELTAAGRAAGLGPLETARTISSGLRAGMGSPRDPGEPTSGAPRPLRELTPAAAIVGNGAAAGPEPAAYLQPAGTWLRALPDKPEPIWGSGDTVLWAQGEALMIAGSPGLGKTTLAGQLVRARLGHQRAVLDMPVAEGGRLLYLMMDRPRQIARRLLQQFTDEELAGLDERMTLGVGPPPADMARNPDLLLALCQTAGADTVVVDSLKDAAIGLVEDEVGAGWNRARQLAVAAGVEVLELHHLVKRGANGKDPETLSDVYGSGHLTSGVGSVLVLLGDAGSPVVKVRHLKPPMEPFGPAVLLHDHAHGVTTVHERIDLLELLAIHTVLTPRSAAVALFDTDKPRQSDIERARRKLEQLVAAGKAIKRATTGGAPNRAAWTYHPLTARSLTELGGPPPEPSDLTLDLGD